MTDFKLSAQLVGHESDVRAATFPSPDTVLTASRDCSVRIWRRTQASPPELRRNPGQPWLRIRQLDLLLSSVQ
ncbi:WD repeat protein Lub1 [Fusarium oxysporum]|nr:WD repeat protein Lub1 [Fusarium oxysporum]